MKDMSHMKELSRVLVTGGAGMIGRRAVEQLNRQGIEVAVFDNLSSGLPMPQGVARAVTGDIRDADLLGQICRSFRPDGILHLAAVHHIPTCETQRAYSLAVNVAGTENVLCAAEAAGVKRVTLASSGAVYAWDDAALTEDNTALWACDNYAVAKTSNESQLRFWTQRTGGIGRAARLFNTIAHDDPNAHLIPDVTTQLKNSRGATTIRLGNLAPKRDYIHAEDAAAGLVALLHDSRADTGYDVFNICSGEERSVEQLVQEIAAIIGHDIHIETDPTRLRKVDRLRQLGNPDKARRLLGWFPRMSFTEALRLTIHPQGKAGV